MAGSHHEINNLPKRWSSADRPPEIQPGRASHLGRDDSPVSGKSLESVCRNQPDVIGSICRRFAARKCLMFPDALW